VEGFDVGLIFHSGVGLEGPIHGTINIVSGPRANHEYSETCRVWMGCDAVVVKAVNITEESAAFIYNVVPEDPYRSSTMTISTKLHVVTRRSPTGTECFDMTVFGTRSAHRRLIL
jgi:hypothetical protein